MYVYVIGDDVIAASRCEGRRRRQRGVRTRSVFRRKHEDRGVLIGAASERDRIGYTVFRRAACEREGDSARAVTIETIEMIVCSRRPCYVSGGARHLASESETFQARGFPRAASRLS